MEMCAMAVTSFSRALPPGIIEHFAYCGGVALQIHQQLFGGTLGQNFIAGATNRGSKIKHPVSGSQDSRPVYGLSSQRLRPAVYGG